MEAEGLPVLVGPTCRPMRPRARLRLPWLLLRPWLQQEEEEEEGASVQMELSMLC